MGIHADLLDPADIVMMAKWLVVAEILYAFNLGWTKISLLMMYYRIFHIPYFKKMAWAVGTFVMVWVVTITFLFIFICVPVAKVWYPDLPGKCINQVATWIANAASTIFTDLIILLMPLPPLWGLKLGKREKIGLTAAFGLGSLYVYAVSRSLTRGYIWLTNPPAWSLHLPTAQASSSRTLPAIQVTLSHRPSDGQPLRWPRELSPQTCRLCCLH